MYDFSETISFFSKCLGLCSYCYDGPLNVTRGTKQARIFDTNVKEFISLNVYFASDNEVI